MIVPPPCPLLRTHRLSGRCACCGPPKIALTTVVYATILRRTSTSRAVREASADNMYELRRPGWLVGRGYFSRVTGWIGRPLPPLSAHHTAAGSKLRTAGHMQSPRRISAAPLTFRRGRREVLTRVQLKGGIWWVAQSQAVIHDVPTCAQVVERIVSDAHMIVETRFARIVTGSMLAGDAASV